MQKWDPSGPGQSTNLISHRHLPSTHFESRVLLGSLYPQKSCIITPMFFLNTDNYSIR